MSDIDALRADLVRAARAHRRVAEKFDPSIWKFPTERDEAACQGSVMAALYAETLAAAFGFLAEYPDIAEPLSSAVRGWLENGPDGENDDIEEGP